MRKSGSIEKGYAERRRKEVVDAKKAEKKGNNLNRRTVIAGLKAGKEKEEMLKDVTVGITMLNRIIVDVFKSGEVTEDEWNEARQNRGKQKEPSQVNTVANSLDEESVVSISLRLKSLLEEGIPTIKIQEVMNIANETYNLAVKYLKENVRLTDKQIIAAREARSIRVDRIVCEKKKLGYFNKEIADMIPYSSEHIIRNVVKRLMNDGSLTDKDIENGRIERKNREELAKEEKILADDEEQEVISEEPYEKQIESLYKLGFNGKQITKITKLSYGYVRKIRDKLGITVEQSKDWQSQRETMANKRKFDISKMVNFSKNIDVQTVQEQIEYLKAEKELQGVKSQDISTIGKVIPMEHRLLTLENINFVIRCLSDLSKLEEAVSFINDCLEAAITYEDTRNNGKLIDMRALLERKIARQKEEQAKATTHKSRRKAWIASSVKATPQGEVKPSQEDSEAPERADTRSVVDSEREE